jgi:hypothetical protein
MLPKKRKKIPHRKPVEAEALGPDVCPEAGFSKDSDPFWERSAHLLNTLIALAAEHNDPAERELKSLRNRLCGHADNCQPATTAPNSRKNKTN